MGQTKIIGASSFLTPEANDFFQFLELSVWLPKLRRYMLPAMLFPASLAFWNSIISGIEKYLH